jgi:hypothetical protein
VWVDSASFAKFDAKDPQLVNETPTDAGYVRSFYHQGQVCDWYSTNEGAGSPDGPYWVSQVQSDKPGACVGDKYCVGRILSGISGDTEMVVGGVEPILTVTLKAGKIQMVRLNDSVVPAKR